MLDTTQSPTTSEEKNRQQVLFFSAPWCQPCQMFGPIVERVKNDYPNIKVQKVDIDSEEGQLLGFKHGVMSIPTLVTDASRPIVGAVSEETLRKWFEHIGG